MFLKNRNIIFKMKISKVTDYAALNNIYKSKFFNKDSFEIISPFNSLKLLCWNSIREYFVFILDYFGLFSFGFRLSAH